MIKSIKIQNYKLFKSLSLEELPRIVLIGGKNNSGKTSVLEAIAMSQDFGYPDMLMFLLDCRASYVSADVFTYNNLWFTSYYHDLELDQPIVFEYEMNSSKKKVIFNYHKNIETSVAINKNKIRKFNSKILEGIEISYWPDVNKKDVLKSPLYFKTEKFVLENRKAILPYTEDTNTFFLPSNQSVYSSAGDADRYSDLESRNNTRDIVKALQILEPNLKSLSILSVKDKPIIYGDVGLEQKIPLFLMGQGMNHLLSILLIISRAKNGIVLIDEFENGFHHSILAKMWAAIANIRNPIIHKS